MDENQTTQELDFSDFYDNDGADDGYQTADTEDTEEAAETETEQTETSEGTDEGDGGDEGTEAPVEQDNDPDEPSEPENQDVSDTFTIKVNKEERTVNREEVISLAQKGADYDRVKQQLADSRQETETLKAEFAKHREVLDLLDLVCKRTNGEPLDIIEGMYIGIMKNTGVSADAAKEALRADKLQKQLEESQNQAKQKQTAEDEQASRAAREVAEFRKEFPGVDLEPLIEKLMEDVQSGMSISSAYRKMQAAEKDAKIAELKRQIAANEQNKKNRAASPGSQKDSGGKMKRDPIDDFIDAL